MLDRHPRVSPIPFLLVVPQFELRSLSALASCALPARLTLDPRDGSRIVPKARLRRRAGGTPGDARSLLEDDGNSGSRAQHVYPRRRDAHEFARSEEQGVGLHPMTCDLFYSGEGRSNALLGRTRDPFRRLRRHAPCRGGDPDTASPRPGPGRTLGRSDPPCQARGPDCGPRLLSSGGPRVTADLVSEA